MIQNCPRASRQGPDLAAATSGQALAWSMNVMLTDPSWKSAVCRAFASGLGMAAGVGWALGNQLWVGAGWEVMAMGGAVASVARGRAARPLWGLRRKPGRLALVVFRLPLLAYRRGWGGLLGHTFLLLVHAGPKTGKPYAAVAMVLGYDPHTHEAVICSGWGQDADWIRNIRARPALRVQIGRESFTPQQRFLSEKESFAVAAGFRHRHPGRTRLLALILGWGDLRSDVAVRDFVRARPFVSFRPAAASPSRGHLSGAAMAAQGGSVRPGHE